MPVKKKSPKKIGRPTTFKKEFTKQIKVACRLGAIDKDLAEMFGVTQRTINAWKKAHPKEFLHTIKENKKPADDQVKKALFQRALGYSHEDVDIRVIENEIVETKIIKHYPPEVGACVFWLSNRDGENWKRNGAEHDGSNSESPPLNITFEVKPAVSDIQTTNAKS